MYSLPFLILEGIIQQHLLRVLSRMIYETEGEVLFLIFLQTRVVVQGFLLKFVGFIPVGINRLLLSALFLKKRYSTYTFSWFYQMQQRQSWRH